MDNLRIQVYAKGRWFTTVMSTTNPRETIKQYKRVYDRVKVEYIDGTKKS